MNDLAKIRLSLFFKGNKDSANIGLNEPKSYKPNPKIKKSLLYNTFPVKSFKTKMAPTTKAILTVIRSLMLFLSSPKPSPGDRTLILLRSKRRFGFP